MYNQNGEEEFHMKQRLNKIVDMIPECEILVDIGTDHAYVPIEAIRRKKCKRAIASDVRKGPILAAGKNIRSFNLEDRIETRLGDGLRPVETETLHNSVIVIAGMGGILIRNILKNGVEKAEKAKMLLLQPMNAVEVLRKWLGENGFEICDEELVEEDGKIYVVLSVKWIGETRDIPLLYRFIGQKLVEKKDPLLKKYLQRQVRIFEKIVAGQEKANVAVTGIDVNRELLDAFRELMENL